MLISFAFFFGLNEYRSFGLFGKNARVPLTKGTCLTECIISVRINVYGWASFSICDILSFFDLIVTERSGSVV